MAIGTQCEGHGDELLKRIMPCPDGRAGCGVLHYRLYCPRCEELAKMDADAKLERLILRKFREEGWLRAPQKHLAACEEVRAKHVSGQDSTCGEGTCEIARLEAVIKCPHGRSAEYEWHDWATLAELFEEMDKA